MSTDTVKLDHSELNKYPPPGIFFTKATFEKYSCLHLAQQDQDPAGLLNIPALGYHLPEHIPPLPQPDEHAISSNGRASQDEDPSGGSLDVSSSSEGLDEHMHDSQEQSLEAQPEEQLGEEMEESDYVQRVPIAASPEVLKGQQEGERAAPPDITSEDLWGSDPEDAAGDEAVKQMPTAGQGLEVSSADLGAKSSTSQTEACSEKQEREPAFARRAEAAKAGQQAQVAPGQPPSTARRPANKVQEPAEPSTQDAKVLKKQASASDKGHAAASKGAAQHGKAKESAAAAAAAASGGEPHAVSEIDAANAEVMRAFSGLGKGRSVRVFGSGPKQATAHRAAGRAARAARSGSAGPHATKLGSAALPASGARAAQRHTQPCAEVAGESVHISPAEAETDHTREGPSVEAALEGEAAQNDSSAAQTASVDGGETEAVEHAQQVAADRQPMGRVAAGSAAAVEANQGSAAGTAGAAAGQGMSAAADGGGGAAAETAGSLCDLLNPNSHRYDLAFALEYAQIRDAAGMAEGRGARKRGTRQIWSKLCARDHAWFLQNQGRALQGREAERMAELSARVAAEQQLFLKSMWALPADAAPRYSRMDPRAGAQLKAHMAAKREAVRQLPRLWCLKSLLGLAEVTPQKTEPAMVHLSTAHASGTPAPFLQPPNNLHINLDHPYLRQTPLHASADTVATFPGQSKPPKQALGEDDVAIRLAAEKRAAAALAASAFGALARTFPPALSPGWEIPVNVIAMQQPAAGEPGCPAGGAAGSAGRAVAFLEKPLVPRELSRREQLELLYRHALLAQGRRLSAGRTPGQEGGWRQRLMQQLAQEMGAGAGASGLDAGGAERTADGAVDQTSEGALSAELEAELAADVISWAPGSDDTPGLPEGQPSEAQALACANGAQSQVRYDLWRLGPFRMISRASIRASVQPESAFGDATPLAVAAKMEYHGEGEEDAEELTGEELCRWWSHAVMRPGSSIMVGHVGVNNSKLLRSERHTARSLQERAASAGFSPAFLWRLLQELLRTLGTLRPGRYLLTHAPASGRICLFAALPDDPTMEQVEAPPLPCDTGAAAPGAVYDLWAAHVDSGATDERQVSFVPKRWRPSHAEVPQVPYTFALKAPTGGPRGGRGRGARDGGGGGRKRQRRRKLMPSAWTIGQRPDWDDVPQGDQQTGASDGGFSPVQYVQQLGEDLS